MTFPRYGWQDLAAMLGLALIYAGLAKIVLTHFSEIGNVTLVWFSGGVGLAVLLLKGIGYWPGIFIGAYAAGLMVDDSFGLSFFIATGNTLESVLAAWLLQARTKFSIELSRPGHFVSLTLVAAGCSLISAVLGPLAIWRTGLITTESMPLVVLHWWMADVFGIVSTTPVLLIWRRLPAHWFRQQGVSEALLFAGLTLLVGLVIFVEPSTGLLNKNSSGYWMYLCMIWGALRFGRHGVMLVSSVAAVLALFGAAHHRGLFGGDFQETGMLNFWFYMAMLSWTGTILALTLHRNREVTQNLLESERHLRAIIDASPVPHAVFDDLGNITLLNKAFVNTFAYTLEDIPTLNDWWLKAYPDRDYRQWVIVTWQALLCNTKQKAVFETMQVNICCKNGEFRTVLGGNVVLGESFVGSNLAILFDITEQLKSREALEESNRLLQTILETLPIRVFWKDLQSRYLGCNGLFAKDLGFKEPNDLLGKDDFQLGLGEQAACYQREDRQVLESGESKLAYERLLPAGDNGIGWLRISKLPLRNARQEIIGVLGVYEDITERKESEQKLAQSLSTLQATFEATADGILVVDLDGKISAFNQQFVQLWGLPDELVENRDDAQALAFVLNQLKEPERFLEKVQELYANPEVESFDLLEFNNGKILERFSQPQRIDEKIVGRVWSFRDITVRKHVEEQLLWRTAFLESLLESTPDGIIVVDFKGNKLLQNHRVAQLWQIPEEIAEGNDDVAQIEFAKNRTTDPEEFVKTVKYIYDHPEVTVHDEIELRDGKILERFSSPVNDRLGQCYGRIWIFRDISEMRVAERALRQQEFYQRSLLDNFPFMVWLKDQENRYLAVNKVFTDMLCAADQEIVGKTDFDLMPAEIAARYYADDREVIVDKHQKNIEIEIDDQGVSKWMEVYKAPLIDDRGVVLGTVGFARDISRRKQSDERLRLAALVYQNSSEAMVVTDADNKILTVNPAFTAITGYSPEEVVGKDPKLLSSGEHKPAFYQSMWEAINHSGSWRGEIKNRHKNGELYIEELTINTIFDDNGRVQRRVALFSDITQRKRSEEQIWRQANFDPLTGLPNRRMLRDRLEQEIKKAHRMGQTFGLLFIDLDRFKVVNDTLGHEMGDILLKDAGERLASCVRESDTVARLGGDEFTIILSEMESVDSPERVAVSLLHKLSQPFQLGDELAYVSASVGITVYPDDATELGQLLKNADQAMYAAKNQGRNCYSFFTPSMQEALKIRATMLGDLRTALADRQFALYYQPIVDLATGVVCKAEALLRWQHPLRGLVSPAEFIPLAEESGLINEIGEWVFRSAAAQAVAWRQSLCADFQISINMSPLQFQKPQQNSKEWHANLQQLGLPGHSIVVEITESLLLEASPVVADHLLIFRDAGIQVAIDDFGTGYSALSYLKRFDIDYLKIDQSFVRNLSQDSSDFVLCEAIIVMAHKLGLKVIAEGVETELQRDLLAGAGCDYAQGFFYAKPLVVEAFLQRFGCQI